MGNWNIILPDPLETNLVLNPSIELNTTGYTAVGGTVALSNAQQRRGAASLAVTPTVGVNDGVFFGTVSLVNGTTYCFDVDVLGVAGIPYQIYFASTVPAILGTPTTFTGTGQWQRVRVFWAEVSTTTRRLYMVKNNSASLGVFYVDGLKVAARSTESTYFDGDSRGWSAGDFYWLGTPHGSQSVRKALIRAGGRVANLETEYGYVVTKYHGTGLNGLVNILLSMALLGGANYQRSVPADHTFTLLGYVNGQSQQDLQQKRRALINGVKPEAALVQQPLLLRYQAALPGSTAYGLQLDIPAVFDAGLESGDRQGFTEPMGLVFHTYLPYVAREDGNGGAALGLAQSIANANGILQRAPGGNWQAMGTGAAGTANVRIITVGPDGTVYVTGSFTLMNSVANTLSIAKWDGTVFTPLGTGLQANSNAYAMTVGPDGTLYVGGDFATAGGVANTVNVAKWNGSVWSPLSTGTNNKVWSLVVGNDGLLYMGGSFSTPAAGIAKWTGAAWSALGTGIAGGGANVYASVIGADGFLYIAGDFTTANGVACANIAKWNGTTFVPLGTGLNGFVNALAVGPDGALYAGGRFTTAGGVSAPGVARWNGSSWSALGTGVSGGTDPVYLWGLSWVGNLLYISGQLTSAGGLTPPTSLIVWNGSNYVFPDFILPGAPTVGKSTYDKAGNQYIGFSTTGSATVPTSTTIANNGTTQTFPQITIKGAGPVYVLLNATTGKTLYFNLTLVAGETAVLDLTPGAITFTSSSRGNILNTILPGSDLATWSLLPGNNTVELFAPTATAITTTWPVVHHSIDGGAN